MVSEQRNVSRQRLLAGLDRAKDTSQSLKPATAQNAGDAEAIRRAGEQVQAQVEKWDTARSR